MKVFGLSVPPLAFANDAMGKHPAVLQQGDIKKLQESLRREGIRKYQKAENLQVTDMLIRRLQGSFGFGPESVGGSSKGAGKEVREVARSWPRDEGRQTRRGGKEMG